MYVHRSQLWLAKIKLVKSCKDEAEQFGTFFGADAMVVMV
jgi:hypothetical protein